MHPSIHPSIHPYIHTYINQLNTLKTLKTLKTTASWGINVFNVFKSFKNINTLTTLKTLKLVRTKWHLKVSLTYIYNIYIYIMFYQFDTVIELDDGKIYRKALYLMVILPWFPVKIFP